MKMIIRLSLLIMIMAISGKNIVFAQDAESSVKAALVTLFELSKSKTYEKAATLIAYEGDDKARIRKDSYNPLNKDEIGQVKRVCKKISALIDLSSKQENGRFQKEKDGALDTFILEVNFISGDQKLVTAFTFIKTEKGFLLTDIN
ncbi:MAG: hypothetical protein CVV24_08390 [Ignavibacteriae bacterium HGW-Ignavibacteriae-3]|nr:MAG: hypothetical protein CVV24_08390 [Ignavibacteriae bacterium HGW-Ignavibacteriae-3]